MTVCGDCRGDAAFPTWGLHQLLLRVSFSPEWQLIVICVWMGSSLKDFRSTSVRLVKT